MRVKDTEAVHQDSALCHRRDQLVCSVARAQITDDAAISGAMVIDYGEDPGLVCHHAAALACWILDDPRGARQHLLQGTDIAHALGHPFGETQMLWMDALLSFDADDSERLTHVTETLLPLCETSRFALWLAGARVLDGAALAGPGRTAAGVTLAERSILEWRGLGTRLVAPHSLGVLATVLATDGRVTDALNVLTASQAALRCTIGGWPGAAICVPSRLDSGKVPGPSKFAPRLGSRGITTATPIPG